MKKMTKVVFAAMVAAVAVSAFGATQRTFVLVDKLLNMPAYCYRLDDGWEGKGFVNWNMRSDTKLLLSVILSSPSKHLLVQETGPMLQTTELFGPQQMAIYQNPNLMAQCLAAEINGSIVEPGLSDFTATGGRFLQDVSAQVRNMANFVARQSRMASVSAFDFDGRFLCMYSGARCEARYTMSIIISMMPPVRPTLPRATTVYRVVPRLVIAPVGHLDDALRDGGRMIAGGFVNRRWEAQRDRSLAAIMHGVAQGRAEGWEILKQTQKDTSAALDRVRTGRSEQIREVMTVDNPLSPGEKIERPAFFKNAWINGATETLLLSDHSLEPNTIRPLMEQGEWVVVE